MDRSLRAPTGVPPELSLADTLARRLGIDYRERDDALDDLRRNVRLLREALLEVGYHAKIGELYQVVSRLHRELPWSGGRQLENALGVVNAIDPQRMVSALCEELELRRLGPK
jgi:hypothetical protein